MKKLLVVLAAFVAMLAGVAISRAQIVTQVPEVIQGNTTFDFGNGPIELKVVQGNALLFTSQGSGIGSTSGSSTNLTLTAVPATAPCVGCILSGTGITSGTTVTAFNATTSITLSAAMTVAAATPLAWGAACPTGAPTGPVMPVQASVGGDFPFYTQARICGNAQFGPGAAVLPFAIGAH